MAKWEDSRSSGITYTNVTVNASRISYQVYNLSKTQVDYGYNVYRGKAIDSRTKVSANRLFIKNNDSGSVGNIAGSNGTWGSSLDWLLVKELRATGCTPTCRWGNQLPVSSLTLSSSQMFDIDKRPWGFILSVNSNKPCDVIREMWILLLRYRFKSLVTCTWLHSRQDCVSMCMFRLCCSVCPAALSKWKENAIILKNFSHCGS